MCRKNRNDAVAVSFHTHHLFEIEETQGEVVGNSHDYVVVLIALTLLCANHEAGFSRFPTCWHTFIDMMQCMLCGSITLGHEDTPPAQHGSPCDCAHSNETRSLLMLQLS